MPSDAATDHYELTETISHAAIGNVDIAILVEVAPGVAALLPAERQGKGITPLDGEQAWLSGPTDPGSKLWLDLTKGGWKWVQDGAFGQKYWRRDRTENSALKKSRGGNNRPGPSSRLSF